MSQFIPEGDLLPEPLVTVILDNRAAPVRRSAVYMDRWTIRKLNGLWVAWPTDAGVYVDVLRRQQWITRTAFAAALRYVLGKVYAR